MDEQVAALLTALMERNGLTVDDLIKGLSTATPDLHSDFPAGRRGPRAGRITDGR
ncbi:hypothetical protein SVIOM342S_00267 [Streptomyces violaceorubidus]